ncbi:gametogenetin-like isoform X4 [Acanthopagrus latus]|uniref:gametogenetin-like isoform X4 n=1 Tax=Acanthopagrus latus TaxID=8177 RepID=UPI00187BC876|nr:gametogenetin-like isoform X4 [Acanthopagrus latus]
MGLRYFSAEEYFPRTRLDLWSRDGVHLSDREGMGILTQLLWASTEQFLETPPPPPPPPVSPTPSQPLRKVSPKLVVKGEPQVPGPASVAQQQEKESFLPLNPRWFSCTTLSAMEEVSPSQLSDVVDVPSPPARKKVASPAAASRHRTTERRPPRHQSPVNNQVGSPPARLSRRLEDDGPSSPVPRSRTTDGLTYQPAGWIPSSQVVL